MQFHIGARWKTFQEETTNKTTRPKDKDGGHGEAMGPKKKNLVTSITAY